eukprot:COSAG06_NODE_1074_length_10817_cov_7.629315_12_plen_43_part_00
MKGTVSILTLTIAWYVQRSTNFAPVSVALSNAPPPAVVIISR